MSKTILITGVSSGLGKAIAEAALARGHRVYGTLRDELQREEFERKMPGQAFARLLDVTDTAAVESVVRAFEQEHGPIDVLINNAGYGLTGMVEELDLEALRKQFEVNVFAPVALIQAVLPAMRKRRAGHIINVSSMGGIVTFPGIGAYHGSKFAILGLSDTLAQEVAQFGIHVTAILPGSFSSDWNGRSQVKTAHPLGAYDSLRQSKRSFPWSDPAELGRIVAELVSMAEPPQRLLIGHTAVKLVRERLEQELAEVNKWQELSEANGQG